MYNNYLPYQYPQYQPKVEIVKVNGKPGAEAYQLAPNSSVLLLDESQPLVYLKATDGAGYATVTAYSITPYQEPKPADMAALEERLRRVEERLNESHFAGNEYTKNEPTAEANANYDKRGAKSSGYVGTNAREQSSVQTSARNH